MTQEARDRNGMDLKKRLKEMARISELQDGGQALVSRAGFHTGFSCVKSEHTAHKSNSTLVLTVGSLSHKEVINQRGKVLLLRTGRPPKLDPAPPICTWPELLGSRNLWRLILSLFHG